MTVQVELPSGLCALARIEHMVTVEVAPPGTLGSVLDALESLYPSLAGCIRDHGTLRRRPFIRFFADGEDLSHLPPEAPLPAVVANGRKPLLIIGAIAGG